MTTSSSKQPKSAKSARKFLVRAAALGASNVLEHSTSGSPSALVSTFVDLAVHDQASAEDAEAAFFGDADGLG